MKNSAAWSQRLSLFAGPVLALGVVTFVIASRGTAQTSDQPGTAASGSPAPGNSAREVFQINLRPVNTSVSQAQGDGQIVVDGNTVGVFLHGLNLDPSISHNQHIHLGTECPTFNQDSNQDGIIDAVEAESASGPVGLPLSLNLLQVLNPTGNPTPTVPHLYPVASPGGTTTYITSIPIEIVTNALTTVQPLPSVTSSPSPDVSVMPSSTSTGSSNNLNLEGRVVEIHGISTAIQLPDTVQSTPNESVNESIPVACGVITRVTE